MSFETAVHNPAHPLYALNQAYQSYVEKARKAPTYSGLHPTEKARFAFYQKELAAYREEEEHAKSLGLSFQFVPLQGDPRWGYFALIDDMNDAERKIAR